MRTLKEVNNYIEELEENVKFMERCYFSNDVLISNSIDYNEMIEADKELKYYERISNKLFNKFIYKCNLEYKQKRLT